MRSFIRVPEGTRVLDQRHEGVTLPQESIRKGISCAPANWRDLFDRAIYRDEYGNPFVLEYRQAGGGLPAYIYVLDPVETEEHAEREPFTHTIDEMEALKERDDYE